MSGTARAECPEELAAGRTDRAPGPHEYGLRVYYEDTDAGGIVYHANYLKFAERARTEALIDLGFRQTALEEEFGALFVVRAMAIDYRASARLEERLVVRTRVTALGGARVEMRQDVIRPAADGAGERLLVGIDVTLVCITRELRAIRMPDHVRARLATLADGPLHEGRRRTAG